MTELVTQIRALLDAPQHDLAQIEQTLTDGYAHALTLEAEQWRLEKRLTELARRRDDAEGGLRELNELAERIDGNQVDQTRLRALLGELRRHANGARASKPDVVPGDRSTHRSRTPDVEPEPMSARRGRAGRWRLHAGLRAHARLVRLTRRGSAASSLPVATATRCARPVQSAWSGASPRTPQPASSL